MQVDPGKNYFELFDLPVGFSVDLTDLSSRYRELQRNLHPDRYAGGSDTERRLSVQMTALVNEAYRVLKDPLQRGRYLLGLRGVDTEAETDTAMDPEFLMEQMELRESVAAARAGSEHAAAAALAVDVQQRINAKLSALAAGLDGDADLERARGLVRELQFLDKLQREVEALEEDLS
jgi:molecular chaperone HscB